MNWTKTRKNIYIGHSFKHILLIVRPSYFYPVCLTLIDFNLQNKCMIQILGVSRDNSIKLISIIYLQVQQECGH